MRDGMDQEMRDLIEECIQLQQELGLLTPIMLFLNPSWNLREAGIEKVSTKGWLRFRERWKRLGGWDRVRREYVHQERTLKEKLSDLAEMLEEKGFEIERLKPELSEEQFSWLLSQKGTIKRHLKGIEIGKNGGR
jgi:hypothetical protein